MRTFWIITVTLSVIVVPALSQYSISGEITGGVGGFYPKAAIAFPIEGETFSYSITFFGSYTIADLPPGGYIVGAFQDINMNIFPDPCDPFGYYNLTDV